MQLQHRPTAAHHRALAAARPARAQAVRVRAAVGSGQQQIVVKRGLEPEKLRELGVERWPTWGCEASTFPWSYAENESCYVLEGRVVVTPDGGEPVEIAAGDFATFPSGMSCTWDVKEAIRKHYNFH